MSIVIKVENLSKAYQLGEIGTGTISRDLERWWARFWGKEDPFLRIGETNDRSTKGTSDIVWSLKDLNFEIEQGDAVGIIGRNGAGKSTLLKILSRVTSPTTGSIKVKGRIASLLEVGTGFHPELTGRENIYLNGAILGMRKTEIKRKFDEIVNFSGVERYIDTPVKRYSSGMYVRLAFAVAAHLESEILIVDEVLAVGDTEFQKKCLGKMGDVNRGEGRTILFVSHNMSAIISLCKSGMLLEQGQHILGGSITEVTNKYLEHGKLNTNKRVNFGIFTEDELLNTKRAKIFNLEIINDNIRYLDPLIIEMSILASANIDDLIIGIGVNTMTSIRLLTVENIEYVSAIDIGKMLKVRVVLPVTYLAPGEYTLSVGIRQLANNIAIEYIPDVIKFSVESTPCTMQISNSPQLGIRPASEWEFDTIN